MPYSGNMTTGNSDRKVKEEDPVASGSSERMLSTLGGVMPLAGICNVETKALQAPSSSTAAAQFPVREVQLTTLQASISSGATQFPIWDEEEQTSDQLASLWPEAFHRLGATCSMEFNAPSTTMCPTEATESTGREERTRRTLEQAVTLSWVVEVFGVGLENVFLSEDRDREHNRRSPLPTWYPRRPLQDITAVLNIGLVPPEEASSLKKASKKAQSVQLHGHLHDHKGGAFGQQRAPPVPFKPTSSVAAASPKKSLLPRKGFR